MMHSVLRTPNATSLLLLAGMIGANSTRGETTHTVLLMHDRFDPSSLMIRPGDTVHWDWVVNFHNVESGIIDGVNFLILPDGRFRSGDPNFDLTFDFEFDRGFLDANPSPDSAYPYYCVVHGFEGMTGVIEVVVAGDADLDMDVDLDDHAGLTVCLLGPIESGFPPNCGLGVLLRLDTDVDGDIDLHDVAEFQNLFAG